MTEPTEQRSDRAAWPEGAAGPAEPGTGPAPVDPAQRPAGEADQTAARAGGSTGEDDEPGGRAGGSAADSGEPAGRAGGGSLPPIGDSQDDADFAGEHDSATFAHQLRGGPERAPDEATPTGRGGEGGMDIGKRAGKGR